MKAPFRRSGYLALAALVASAGTLVCCVLPALMVALGAGATLAGLVTAIPQLVWLSEHKALVFGLAATALFAAGLSIWRARSQPCPADQAAARTCNRVRRLSEIIYWLALTAFFVGATFAFVLPAFAAETTADPWPRPLDGQTHREKVYLTPQQELVS